MSDLAPENYQFGCRIRFTIACSAFDNSTGGCHNGGCISFNLLYLNENFFTQLHSIWHCTTFVSVPKVILTRNRDYCTGALAKGESKYDEIEKRLAAAPSPCLPSLLKVMPTVRRTRTPVPRPRNSRADTHTGSSTAASGTTCLRKRPGSLPRLRI